MKAALLEKLRTLRSFTTLIVLFVGGGAIYILPYLSSYFYIPMKDAMHLSNVQIGMVSSAVGFTSMLFYWPGGWMADRFSPRKLIAFSMVVNGLLGFWLATMPSFKVLLAIYLLMGVFLTLTFWSAMIKMVRLLAPADKQGRYFGILEGGRNLTTVALVAAALLLFDSLGGNQNALRWAIILFSAMLILIGVLSWICLPDPVAAGASAAEEKGTLPAREAIGRVVRIPAVWLAMSIILCAYVTSVGITYLTPYATDVYGQSVVTGGMLFTAMLWIGMFSSPIAGFLADRWTTSRTIIGLLLALVLCWLLFVIVPGSRQLFVLLLLNSIVIGFVIYALRGIYFALLEEGAIPVALTGMATGLISMVAYTPDVFVPALAGHLLDRYATGGAGYRYLFMIIAIFSFAGVVLTLLFRSHIRARSAGIPIAQTRRW